MENDAPGWFTHVTLGSWNPEGCLVSVIDDPVQAARAVDALRTAGFADEQIRLVLVGDVSTFGELPAARGMARQAFFMVTNLSDDSEFEEEYRDEARRGHPILIVHAPRSEQSARARAVLRDFDAHTVTYYGHWIVRGFD